MLKKAIITTVLLLQITCILFAQTIGGSSIYNFLKVPQHPLTGALGGRNISSFCGELGMVAENPALLNELNHGNLSTSFTLLAPTLSMLNAAGAFNVKNISTTFAFGINHLQYGSIDQTDASGNSLGIFNPFDQALQISGARTYNKNWHYGIALKYVNSSYGAYRSSAIASDVGLAYYDEEKLFQVGFSAKNMGTQLKTYAGVGEDLPFDISLGITKQLEKAPIRLSMTAQHIHQFDIIYIDTIFNSDNFNLKKRVGFGEKLISHFILASDLLLGSKLVFTAGYNFLRRKELKVSNLSNGFTGLSYGMNYKLNKLDFYFSRSHYQSAIALTQVGFSYKFVSEN
jgi:hypothetical protein